MTDYEKILEWCDRHQSMYRRRHGFTIYKTSAMNVNTHDEESYWIVMAEEYDRDGYWSSIESAAAGTPEEAIAQLVRNLGL